MPRNGSGVYSLPAGNPVVTGTQISSTTHNNTNTDMANALTQSLSADGQTPMTGPQLLFAGSTVPTPASGDNTLKVANTAFVASVSDLTSLKSINGGQLAGLRNKLIGGHFDRNPWQRGTTFTVTASGTYVADRWRVDFDGTANITVSKVTLPVAQLINGVWCSYGLKFLVNSKSGNTFIRLSQRIEDVDTLTGSQATLQTAILGSGSFTVPINMRQNFGAGGSADVVTPLLTNLAVTTGLQQLNSGLTIPSISGKTIGTANDYVATEYDLLSIPAAGYVVIALAGLEPGTVASIWEDRRRIELSLCQRYYYKGQGMRTYNGFGSAITLSACTRLPVPMRSSISATVSSGTVDLTSSETISSYGFAVSVGTWYDQGIITASAEL
jgi:hypothetical protein